MIKKTLLVLILLLSGCSKSVEPVEPASNSVFYEIFVGSFYDTDGDGMGDLKGVEMKLDYIQNELGAQGIWLMPIHPSPSYHKYDVLDYKAIDPKYGTMEDFDSLVNEMNDRGMTLILDLVLNHSSVEHPWFKASRDRDNCSDYCDYYTFSEVPVPGYHVLNNSLYYESEFTDTMPDLNLDSEGVRNEIKDITKFWVDKGVGGFRLDATTHFYADNTEKNIDFLKWFSDYAYSLNPDLEIVGEAWAGSSIVSSMFASNISFFNFGLAQNSGSLVKSINREKGYDLAVMMAKYQASLREINPKAIDSIFFSNHDQGRSASYFANQLEKQKLAASIYLLLPGNAYIYYGEEIGMIGSGKDENKRLPMLWGESKGMTFGPSGSDYDGEMTMDLKSEEKDKNSLLNHYKKVTRVRNQYLEISRGEASALDLNDPALFAQKMGDIIVVHNFSNEKKSIEGSYEIVDKTLGGTQESDTIVLEGYSSVIIKEN